MRVRGIERESQTVGEKEMGYIYRDVARVIDSETGRVIDSES